MRLLLVLPFFLLLLARSHASNKNKQEEQQKSIQVSVWAEPAASADDPPLKAADFQAKVEGTAAAVLSGRTPEDDLLLILVMDVTGDLSLVSPAKETITAEIRKLPANVRVGLMRAQDGLRVLVDPTSDRDQITQTVEQLAVSGNAGFLDTAETAARVANTIVQKTAVRTALLYVTDSNIYNYREDFTNPVINSSDQRDVSRYFPEDLVNDKISKLQNQLAQLPVPLFVVHLVYRSDRLNEAYQAGIQKLAQESGGAGAFCRSIAEIPEAIRLVMQRVQALYLLNIDLPERHPRAIQLTVQSGDRLLHYRNRLSLEGK